MIQRPQSLYLLLSSIFLVLGFWLSIGWFESGNISYTLNLLGIADNGAESLSAPWFFWLLPLLTVGIIVLNLFNIFQYQRRGLQKALISLSITLSLVFYILLFFVINNLTSEATLLTKLNIGFSPNIGVLSHLLSLPLLVLAFRGVQKDQQLLKNTERLR